MKQIFTILVALGCATAYCVAQAIGDTTPQLPPVQSDLMPTIGTFYFISPPEIYKSVGEPGPANSKMNMAWCLGNEFVFRTGLRNEVFMPWTGAGPLSNDWCEVNLMNSNGAADGLLLVNIASNTVVRLK